MFTTNNLRKTSIAVFRETLKLILYYFYNISAVSNMELRGTIIIAILATGGCVEDTSNLNLTGDPNMQLEQVLNFIQLGKNDMNFTLLYKDVRQTLDHVWPGYKLVLYGSLVSGLGIKSSDVDHLIMVPKTKTNPIDLAMRAYQLFLQRPDVFENVQLKTDKRVPIVMFWHIPSRRHSDFTFSGLPSIRNSELIGYILNIDPRASRLAKIVKYWSKIHNLNGNELLSTYCHYLQVIHFLQQKKILPAVKDLQKNVWGLFNDWNTVFDRVEYKTTNNETLYELLGGYFKYYSVFHYEKFIISPYMGQVLERKVFARLDTVPAEFVLYKHNVLNGITKPYPLDGLISIQDPFDHNRNTAIINVERARKVISHFKYAAKMFVEDVDNSFLKSILTRHADYELADIKE